MPDTSSSPDRYAAQETTDGTVRIFDTENDDAWIESDLSLPIGRRT